jgi:hypothetical protein
MISNVVTKKQPTTNPSLISQVYMVPLPDFTVYPGKLNDQRDKYWKIPFKLLKLVFWPRGHILKGKENLSPFLKMIRKDNSAEIYDNPSMAAVIDFKWKAARNHFLRRSFIYVIFGLTFALIIGVNKSASKAVNSASLGLFIYVLMYWLGFYVLNTERIQLKYDGWKRYFSLYNFFDLFSVILPLVAVSVNFGMRIKYIDLVDSDELTDTQINEIQKDIRMVKILNSFTIIVMWMELFLVSF